MRVWASLVAVVAALTFGKGVFTLVEGDLLTAGLWMALALFEAAFFGELMWGRR